MDFLQIFKAALKFGKRPSTMNNSYDIFNTKNNVLKFERYYKEDN